MKEVGLLIDLYQSPTQEERVLRQAASDFFIPLIKLLKKLRNIKVSLNIPLATLEQLDKYGYQSLISDIKYLYENSAIELVGTAAYNALLTYVPKKVVEDQVVLNEYALGYYFGAKQGFEGEPSIMIKDIDGFLPPLLGVNEEVLKTLESFNYSWVLVDLRYLSGNSLVYKIEETNIEIVSPNSRLNEIVNSFSSKSFDELWDNFKTARDEAGDKVVLIINNDLYHLLEDIDSDFYKRKISFIDQLLENLIKENIQVTTVRDLIRNSKPTTVEKVVFAKELESSDNESGGLLRMAKKGLGGSGIIKLINAELLKQTVDIGISGSSNDFSTLCVWKYDELSKIPDVNYHNIVCFNTLLSKCMCLDMNLYLNVLNDQDIKHGSLENQLRQYLQFLRDLVKYRADKLFADTLLPLIDEFLAKSK